MPYYKASKRYKQEQLEKNRLKHNARQKKYRDSKRVEINEKQKHLMRSRLEKFRNGNTTSPQKKKMQRQNLERVQRYRRGKTSEELYLKRKKARKTWDHRVQEYEREIREYYRHTCNSCGRLCRISQMKRLGKDGLIRKGFKDDFISKVFYVKQISESKFCRTCSLAIEKGHIPKLCLSNGLNFPNVDEEILKLNRLEERLLAPRHVFQTIWTVRGHTGQFRTKGGIVNVPVDVDNTVSMLPRPLNQSNMIHVRVARKLEYIKDYMSGIVRPRLLYEAAKKFILKPLPVEEGIRLSEDWNFGDNSDQYDTDLEDEFYTKNAIHETLLVNNQQCCSFTGLDDTSIRIAPAEHYIPTSILFDDKCEYMAFPQIFGGYKLHPIHKEKCIPFSDVAKSMVLRYDRRVAERGDFLLFLAKKLELLKLYNNVGICLRKRTIKGRKVTANDMLDSSYVNGVIHHNDGYKVLRGIRSSPAHWQHEKTKLLAQIRQFGLPSLFITLSAADLHWPELLVALKCTVDNEVISEQEAENLSYNERARLVQKDAITCSLHFDQRFRALKKTWDSPDGPFLGHNISHYYFRIEFQQRG